MVFSAPKIKLILKTLGTTQKYRLKPIPMNNSKRWKKFSQAKPSDKSITKISSIHKQYNAIYSSNQDHTLKLQQKKTARENDEWIPPHIIPVETIDKHIAAKIEEVYGRRGQRHLSLSISRSLLLFDLERKKGFPLMNCVKSSAFYF